MPTGMLIGTSWFVTVQQSPPSWISQWRSERLIGCQESETSPIHLSDWGYGELSETLAGLLPPTDDGTPVSNAISASLHGLVMFLGTVHADSPDDVIATDEGLVRCEWGSPGWLPSLNYLPRYKPCVGLTLCALTDLG